MTGGPGVLPQKNLKEVDAISRILVVESIYVCIHVMALSYITGRYHPYCSVFCKCVPETKLVKIKNVRMTEE